MTRTFLVRKKKTGEGKKSLSIVKNTRNPEDKVYIPKSQILSSKQLNKPNLRHPHLKEKWLEITVTDWIWNKMNLPEAFEKMKEVEEIVIMGETHFDVDWDYVISKRSDRKHCFYCMTKMKLLRKGETPIPQSKTKDHLIPKAVLKAYGIIELPNNTVPCCRQCNDDKANLMPELYLRYAKLKLHETGDTYYRTIIDTLERVIVKDK